MITRSKNFRSRPEVLEGTNDLFRDIMSRPLGEMDYTDDQALLPRGRLPQGETGYWSGAGPVLPGDEEEGKRWAETCWRPGLPPAASGELLEQSFLTEGRGHPAGAAFRRKILLRSPARCSATTPVALGERDIPLEAEGGGDFFGLHRDLGGPVPAPDRGQSPAGCGSDSVLRPRCTAFPATGWLRFGPGGGDFDFPPRPPAGGIGVPGFPGRAGGAALGAGDRTSRQLIWHIYDRTNLLGLFGAMDGGRSGRATCWPWRPGPAVWRRLGCRSLFQFLTRPGRMRETGGCPCSAPGRTGGRCDHHVHPPSPRGWRNRWCCCAACPGG